MASPNAAGTSGAKESSLTALISRLDRRNIPYFYKVMTKTAVTQNVFGPFAYALEFPLSFVRTQGTHFGKLATFQPTNCDQIWPIKITVRDIPTPHHRVFAYGHGGWKAFVVDNHIQVGDTLVFSLVGISNFIVDIIKASPVEGEDEGEVEVDPSHDPSSYPKNIREALVPCKCCREVPQHARYVVDVTPEEVNQLGVPGKFWECFHDMLQNQDLQLKGPNGAVMMVEAEGTFYEKEQELDIYLKSGWKEFFVANNLRIGDLLEFSLVGPNYFLVDVQRL